jgi:hypothetical protein
LPGSHVLREWEPAGLFVVLHCTPQLFTVWLYLSSKSMPKNEWSKLTRAGSIGVILFTLLMASGISSAGHIQVKVTPPYLGGCSFDSPWSGSGSLTSGGSVSFTGPSYSSGTGSVAVSASPSTGSAAQLSYEFVSLWCDQPEADNSSGGALNVSFAFTIFANDTLGSTCLHGSSSATGNASVVVYMFGGSPSGRYGSTSYSVYSDSRSCASQHTFVHQESTNFLTGSTGYSYSDYFAYRAYVFVGGSATDGGSDAVASFDNSFHFYITSVTGTYY